MRFTSLTIVLAGAVPFATATNPCPLEGMVWPKPAKLENLAPIKTAVANLTAYFKQWDAITDPTTGTTNFSYAIQISSSHDAQPLFSYSHTAPKLATQHSLGAKEVGLDTVFRLGSLTKIFTMYTLLLNVGDQIWNDPITKYVPELAAIANRTDKVDDTAWDDITIGALATQMGGVPRDYALLGELLQSAKTVKHVVQYGFPPLPRAEIPPCGEFPLCTRAQFFAGISKFYPSLAPFSSPAYSDVGFQLLGYAVEEITGKSFQSLVQDTVLKPLGLNRTFYVTPADSLGVIPGNVNETGWGFNIGEESPAGNMYSSAADMAAFGTAILNFKQLSPAMTRRWLKPFSFSSDFRASVGAPWGARRIPLGPEYREITAYNKAGRIGSYTALLALIPDYDITFSIMIAGDLPNNINFAMADTIGEQLIPAIEQAAKNEAGALYSGHYVSNSTLNSSMTIEIDDKPGLSISSWISNHTNFRLAAVALQVEYIPTEPSIRLYTTGLAQKYADGTRRIVFKAMMEDLSAPPLTGKMFSTDCGGWVGIESVIYATASVDEIIFHADAKNTITAVEIPALRITLYKQ